MPKRIENQLTYKKLLSFTNKQKKAFEILEKHKVNVNEFIRIAVREKIGRDWKQIKERVKKSGCPF